MNKLFGLFLLALAFLAPQSAWAVNCFWVGGTGVIDGTNTGGGGAGGIKWASASGGASTCAGGGTGGSPSTGDTITFDASSGGGTVTTSTTTSVQSFTAGAFTGTLTVSNAVTASSSGTAIFLGGTGARTIDMGSVTWTASGGGTFDFGTTTNCTACVTANANIVLNGNFSARIFSGGGQTYASLTIGSNATRGYLSINGSNTFGSMTVADGVTLLPAQSGTQTITGVLAITGTSSAPSSIQSSAPSTAVATISVGSASTLVWGSIFRITKSGAGTLTGTNCFDLGGNTSITSCTGPSGGGGGGRIIGG